MPLQKLMDYLDSNNIKYVNIRHSIAYTAQEVAASSHISGKELAKTVIVKINNKMGMAVLSASCQIDFYLLKKTLGVSSVELASEEEFKDIFPGCEVGAMPPFGNLYEMKVLVEESLAGEKEIAFNAGTHTELIKLSYKDFERLVKPEVVKF